MECELNYPETFGACGFARTHHRHIVPSRAKRHIQRKRKCTAKIVGGEASIFLAIRNTSVGVQIYDNTETKRGY